MLADLDGNAGGSETEKLKLKFKLKPKNCVADCVDNLSGNIYDGEVKAKYL